MRQPRIFPILVFTIFLASACKRTDPNKEFVGPIDTTTPQSFAVVGDSISPRFRLVNFGVQQQWFLSRFNSKVSWGLSIYGSTSGAYREIHGVSDFLDSTNTSFDGKGENLEFFLPGETCKATLYMAGWPFNYTCTFVVNSPPSFDCTVLDDFETPSDSIGFCSLYSDPADSSLEFRGGTNASFLEGRQAMKMSGYDTNENYWIMVAYSKGLNFQSILSGKDASVTYFNFFAKGLGNENAVLEVQLEEDENGDGVFTSATDELWKGRANLTGDWKQFSLNLGGFEKSGTSGNGTLNPARIQRISFVLLGIPAGVYSEAYLDFVNFTFGKAFSQR
jgi:hypothetical protein